MSTAAPLLTLAAKPQPLSSSTHAGLLLQRNCACGSPTASLTGECVGCKSKKRLQTKLTLGASNDPLEQEADRVADHVMAASAHAAVSGAPPRIQRLMGQATEGTDTAPASVDRVLASPGRPLEPTLRQDMEKRFGHDFSQVRVHSGEAAEQSARDVNAKAYTVGHDIVWGAGRFAPGTHEGRRLIAHELTHVVQQSGSDGIRAGQSNGKWGLSPIYASSNKLRLDDNPDSPSEKQAKQIAYQVMSRNIVANSIQATGVGIAREEDQPYKTPYSEELAQEMFNKLLDARRTAPSTERSPSKKEIERGAPPDAKYADPIRENLRTFAVAVIIDEKGERHWITRYFDKGDDLHAEEKVFKEISELRSRGLNVKYTILMTDQEPCTSGHNCSFQIKEFTSDPRNGSFRLLTPRQRNWMIPSIEDKPKAALKTAVTGKEGQAVPLNPKDPQPKKVYIKTEEYTKVQPHLASNTNTGGDEKPAAPQTPLTTSAKPSTTATVSATTPLGRREDGAPDNLVRTKSAAKPTSGTGNPPATPGPKVMGAPPKPESPDPKTPPKAESPPSPKKTSEENFKIAQKAQALGALASVAGAYAKSGAENLSADNERQKALDDLAKARDPIFEELWNSPGQGMNVSFMFILVTPNNGQPARLQYIAKGQQKSEFRQIVGFIGVSKEQSAEIRDLKASPGLTVESIFRSIWLAPVRTRDEGKAAEKPKESETTPTFIASFNAFIESTVSLAQGNLFLYELSVYESLKQSPSTLTDHLANFDGLKFQIPEPVYGQLLTYFDSRVRGKLTKTLDGLNRKMDFYAGRLKERREEDWLSKVINQRGDIPLDANMFNAPGSHLASAAGTIQIGAYRHARESLEQAEALLNQNEAWLFRYDKGYFPARADPIQ